MVDVSFVDPPPGAAWRHEDSRSGFEVVYFRLIDNTYRIDGASTAVEDGRTWIVDYNITLDADWRTRTAPINGRSAFGLRSRVLEADGAKRWLVDGESAPYLDDCLDVDLESSAMTNALPVHRLRLPPHARAAAPAAYVRALDLSVGRLQQDYLRTDHNDAHQRYNYLAPAFGFTSTLVYDEAGLVLSYPGSPSAQRESSTSARCLSTRTAGGSSADTAPASPDRRPTSPQTALRLAGHSWSIDGVLPLLPSDVSFGWRQVTRRLRHA